MTQEAENLEPEEVTEPEQPPEEDVETPPPVEEPEQPSDEGESEPEPEPAEEPKPPEESGKSKRYYRRRISELHSEIEGLKRRLDNQEKPPDPQAPNRDDFDNPEDYQEALIDYKTEVKLAEKEKKREEERVRKESEETQTRLIQGWQEKLDDARDRIDNFDEVLDTCEVQFPPPMVQSMMESDIGADLAFYLANHQDKARTIAKLSPTRQIIEMGKLETAVQAEIDKPKPKPVSKAPPPVEPNKGGKVTDDEPSSKDDINTWMEKEKARLKKVRGY